MLRRAIIIETMTRTTLDGHWTKVEQDEIECRDPRFAFKQYESFKNDSDFEVHEYCEQMFLAIRKDDPTVGYTFWLDKWVLDEKDNYENIESMRHVDEVFAMLSL